MDGSFTSLSSARESSWCEISSGSAPALPLPPRVAGPFTRPAEGPAPRYVRVRTDLPFKEAKRAVIEPFERFYVRRLLSEHRGNLSAASRASGLSRRHLRHLLRKHRLHSARAALSGAE